MSESALEGRGLLCMQRHKIVCGITLQYFNLPSSLGIVLLTLRCRDFDFVWDAWNLCILKYHDRISLHGFKIFANVDPSLCGYWIHGTAWSLIIMPSEDKWLSSVLPTCCTILLNPTKFEICFWLCHLKDCPPLFLNIVQLLNQDFFAYYFVVMYSIVAVFSQN